MSHDHVWNERDQFRNESLCAIRLAGPPAIVYPKVVALRPTQLAEPLPKSIDTSLSFWIVLSICRMRRIRSVCCARATSGHAVAPPASVINSRRFN